MRKSEESLNHAHSNFSWRRFLAFHSKQALNGRVQSANVMFIFDPQTLFLTCKYILGLIKIRPPPKNWPKLATNLRKILIESALSKHIWKLKNNKPYNISWSVAAHASPYRCGMRRCDLCLTEKIVIIQADPKTLLNKRTELISKCRHRNKFYVKNIR